MFNKTETPSTAGKLDKEIEERKQRLARTAAAARKEVLGADSEITPKASGVSSEKERKMIRTIGEETQESIEKGLKWRQEQRHKKAEKMRKLMDAVRKELGMEESAEK